MIGTCYGKVQKHWIDAVGENRLPVLKVEVEFTHRLEHQQWIAIDPLTLVHTTFLVKKNGSVNTKGIKSSMQALNIEKWNTQDVIGRVLEGLEVRGELEEEEYNGRTKTKVAWLNNINYAGSSKATDTSVVQDLDAKYGSVLRGITLDDSPKPQAAVKTTAKAVVPSGDEQAKKAACWEALKKNMLGATPNELKARWSELLKEFETLKKHKAVSVLDWNEFEAYINPLPVTPVDQPPAIADDDIPF